MRHLLFVFLIASLVSCQPKDHKHTQSQEAGHAEDKIHNDFSENDEEPAKAPLTLIGKTVEYQYGENIYHVTFDSETHMHWEAIAGDEKGVREEETYKLHYLNSHTLFITWGEANGIGVSQVLDFENGIVYNHLLRDRDVSIGEGQIRILLAKEE